MKEIASYIPIIDISELMGGSNGDLEAAKVIGAPCRDRGLFYISGHDEKS